jgi:flagellin
MSLGVLNNLSAMYAENNLNNTSNSLNTVLQQLSSGSKINSGADDAAGLSLVDGLQANSMALAQSQTNASEGVGLLKVADGALSQVTNLLNRAVTLATEASNGTLNNSQDAAANSEYQSILSEINNIGATTTYNGQTVFGAASPVNIYTGDSSTAGASIDALNIASLSSSNVGDTGGVMAYSNGSNNVFLNLSSSTANAAATDYLNGGVSGTTNLNVTYAVPGGSGSNTTATTSVTVGAGSNYANTSNGLISAINNAGLGLTATFATQTQAGVQGGGFQTGIEITGGLISAGVDPSASSTSGTLNLSGLAAGATLAQGSTLTITDGSTTYGQIVIGSTNNTLATLAGAIATNTGSHVAANVITNGDGTQSLQLSDNAGGGALSVATTSGTPQAPIFASGGTGQIVSVQAQGTDTVGTQAVTGVNSTVTVGTGSGTELYSDLLSAGSSISITNSNPANPQTLNFTVGAGTDNTAPNLNTYYTGNQNGGNQGDTLGNLADTINAKSGTLGVYATVTSNGLQLNSGIWTGGKYATSGATTAIAATQAAVTGENVSATSTLSSATTGTALNLYSPSLGGVPGGGQPQIMAFSATNAGAAVAAVAGNTLTGTFQITGSQGASATFTMGPSDTYTSLISDINNANVGVSASWNATLDGAGKGGLELTSTDSTNVMTVANGLTDSTAGHGLTQNTVSVVAFGTGVANESIDTLAGAVGSFAIVGSGGTYTSVAGDNTIGILIAHINAAAGKDLTASFDQNVNGGNGGILVVDSGVGAADNLSVAAMTDTNAGGSTAASSAAAGNGRQEIYGLSDGQNGVSANDALSGSVQITGPHGVSTFALNGTTDNYNTLVSKINSANLGVTAAFSANADGGGHGGIVLTGADTSNVIAAVGAGFKDGTHTITGAATQTSINTTDVATASTAVLQLSGANISDAGSTLNGAITIAYHETSQTFVMGNNPGATTPQYVNNAIYTGGTTVQDLVNAINSTQTGGQNNALNTGGLTFQASAPGIGTGGIYLQGMSGYTGAITLTTVDPTVGNGISTPLSVTSAMAAGSTTNGLTGVTGINAGDNITTGGTTIATSDTMAGSITVTNGGNNVGLDSGTNGVAVGLASTTQINAAGSTSSQDVLTSGTTFSFTTNAGNTFSYTAAAGDTWQTLATDINNSATVGSSVATGVTASWSASAGGAGNGGIVLTNNYNGPTTVTINASTLTDQSLNNISAHNSTTPTPGEVVAAGANGAPTITGFRGGATDLVGDTLTANSSATFAVNGQSYTYTAAAAGTDTWQTLITDINSSSIGKSNPYGVTASWSATGGGAGDPGMVLTNNWDAQSSVTYTTGGITLKDSIVGTNVGETQTQAGGGSATVSALDSGAAAASTDSLTGSITLTSGAASYSYTAAAGSNWQTLVSDINNSAIGTADSSGVTAKWNANADGTGNGGIVLTGNETGANPVAITGNSLVDQASATTDTFTVGSGANGTNQFYTQSTNGATYANNLSGLASMVSAQSTTLHVAAQANASGLTFTQTVANGGSIATNSNSLTDVTAGSYLNSTAIVAGQNDTLSGALVFNVGTAANQSVTMAAVTASGQAATVQGLINYIHTNAQTTGSLGIDAQWVPNTTGNLSFGTIKLISSTEGTGGAVNVSSGPTGLTSLTDTTVNSTLSYTAGAAYNTGLSNGTHAVLDQTTAQTAATFTSQDLKGSGIATISYSDAAGQSLSSSDLTNSTNAKSALTALNAAITDVASQDGYIGAQINTLNSVSSVLSTQQQNVTAAQNAVQATDYASAASNMSKYEILSQTGISALAQANSMQQEVTKLLQ